MKEYIGVVGPPNAGKGATAEMLAALLLPGKTQIIEFGDPFRAAAHELGLPAERDVLSKMSTWVRETFDPALVAKRIGALAEQSSADYVLMVGMRKLAVDVPMVRSFPGSRILYVTAPQELRYKLSLRRGRPGEATTSWERFCEQDRLETEREIRDIGAQADFTVVNDRDDETFAHIKQQLLDGILKVLPAPGSAF